MGKRTLAFVALAIVAIGCGKSGPRSYSVSGTVTCNGELLPEGTIVFKTEQTGVVDSLPIKDGKFEGKAAEGQRRVEVSHYQKKVVGTGQMVGEVQENTIASPYNTDSKLTATVTSTGPNEFKFEVKRK